MPCRRVDLLRLGLLACAFGAAARPAGAQEASLQRWTAARLPLDQMPAAARERVRNAVDHPTLYAQGSTETFPCNPAVYDWFLDHPDRAVAAWRKLGAKVVDISDRGNGRYGWADGLGGDVVWEVVARAEGTRVWHAEGKVKPGPLLAAVPFQAVVVLRYNAGQDGGGRSVVRHQADLILHTDSKSALLVAKLLGGAGPRMADQYVAQMEMFLSALPWYVEQHPERAQELLAAQPTPPSPPEAPEPRKRPGLFQRRGGTSPPAPAAPPGG